MVRVAPIVEGHGEVEAVPTLIRRIAQSLGVPVEVLHPIRQSKQKLLKPGEMEKAVELAARNLEGSGGIFVIVDADEACPAELGPQLRDRVRAVRPDLPSALVLPKYEFEAWFLAAAASLRGTRGLDASIEPPTDPEAIRGAKEWLSDRRTDRHGYSEPLDQPALTAVMDLDEARACPSFDKCYREIAALLDALR